MSELGVTLRNGGVLDIGVDFINSDPNEMFVSLPYLCANPGAKLILRPDLLSIGHDSSEPLLKLGNVSIDDPSLKITIIPRIGFNGRLEDQTTFKLLELTGSYDEGELEELQSQLLGNVKSSGLYQVLNARFEDTVLLCDLKYLNVEEVLAGPIFGFLPSLYQGFASTILQQTSTENTFTQSLFTMLASATTPEEANQILRDLTPTNTDPSSGGMGISPSGRSANNIIRVARNSSAVQALMGSQGPKSQATAQFMKKSSQNELRGANLMGRHHARGTDSGSDIRLQDFQNVGLDGLTVSSETSYAHQVVTPQGSEDPGTTQSSWATSLGASYTKNKLSVLGTILTTVKGNESLNPNQIQKTMHRGDRYNSGGILGLYQQEGQPWYASGVITYGQHNYDMERTWNQPLTADTSVSCSATAEYTGYELYVTTEAGWKYQLAPESMLQPYLGCVISRLATSEYTESSVDTSDGAANEYGLIVPAQHSTNLSFNTGIEMIRAVKSQDIQYQITTRMGWTPQKTTGQTSTFTYAYQADPDLYYSVEEENIRYNTFDLSFGIHSEIRTNLEVSAMYTGNYGSKGNTHTAMVTLEYHIA